MREVATSRDWNLVWDIGCNNGRYSRIAAEGARTVLAVDADQGPVELLYRDLRDERNDQILTLTMNLADPSPGLGWRGLERKSLPERGKPDLVLALALVHHVAISANVPVKEFIDWLASLDTALVIEFPTREDPMVKKLLAPKRDGLHPDYELDFFERTLNEAFEVERSERLESGTRVLYYARPKGMSREAAKEAAWAYLNLAVLWTFAVAQPLFDLLKDNPEFFAARGSTGFDIVSFSVLLVVLPPLLLLGIELLLGLDPARGAQGRAHRLPRRARRADRRAGPEEVDRRLGRRADRAVRGGRSRASPRSGRARSPSARS